MIKLGIIGAMDIEVALLKEQLTDPKVTHKAGSEFWAGTLRGLSVVIVRCGVGKVNAALCVQILADLFDVTHIVNTGIAGSMDADLNIGDLVVATEAMYHDMTVTIFGYPRGQVPGMDVQAFPADVALSEAAAAACAKRAVRFKRGRIVSGDQFVGDSAVKDDILENCGGLCVEMESAAIAHAAYQILPQNGDVIKAPGQKHHILTAPGAKPLHGLRERNALLFQPGFLNSGEFGDTLIEAAVVFGADHYLKFVSDGLVFQHSHCTDLNDFPTDLHRQGFTGGRRTRPGLIPFHI